MAALSPLNSDISEPFPKDDTKCAILEGLWEDFNPQHFSNAHLLCNSYLRYYTEQCRSAPLSNGLDSILTTHQDVVTIVRQLKGGNLTRENIKDNIRAQLSQPGSNNTDRLLCESIDLAVRLWLMLDVGEMQHAFIPGQKSLRWESGHLKDLISSQFNVEAVSPAPRIKLERIFTAQNLEHIAGLQIFWTSNLADHLRLMHDDSRIAIFHHVSFLKHHKKSAIFPSGFIEETLRKLSLLLPQYDKSARKWFRSQQTKFYLDSKACEAGHLTNEERQIGNFAFWHDRIAILKQAFDEAEPGTITQWWCDRRRRVQWYTFWVAALILTLTIFFGVVQCIEGGYFK